MALAPFTVPTLAQVAAVQTALTPLTWGTRGTFAWRQGLKIANEALADGVPVAQAALITRTLGEMSYLFRYKSDPSGFTRMIVKKDAAIGPNFELTNKDEKKWLKTLPLVIAVHEPSSQAVGSRLYLQASALLPVASRDGEFLVSEELAGGSEAFRLIASLLWAGLGVHLDAPKKNR